MNHPRKNQGGKQWPLETQSVQLGDVIFSGEKINPELFSSIANSVAQAVASNDGSANKATQLRRFYDEVCLWHQKVQAQPDRYEEYLPFIKMIGAKVAYAKGRKLVDDNFYKLIEHCLKQITTKKGFDYFKTFFEAFMGFYKMHKPK